MADMEAVTHSPSSHAGATMYEVAQRAGVSVATVSRLLNESGYVSARARGRVQTAMNDLGYEPNGLARSLATRQSEMLALLLTDIANPFSAQIARGMQDAAQDAGYVPIICSIDGDPTTELKTVRMLRRKRVDGIILTPGQGEQRQENSEALRALAERGLPIVCVGRRLEGATVDRVSTDTVAGARDAVDHLVALGHRRIGFVGGPFSRGVALGRLEGYRDGLRRAGLAYDEAFVRQGELDEESGQREALALLTAPRRPTALLCVNDRTAFGVLAAAAELGLRVPHDLSVVGFDDVILASLVQPALTTVRQPARELGQIAVRFLLQRITTPRGPSQSAVLPCLLVVRRSTGPPAPT